MDWSDIRANQKVKVITEQEYRGILCTWVENKGWKITLGNEEYLLRNFQEAKKAIDKIHEALMLETWAIKIPRE